VAPVALHPDLLLSQMLMASTYPTEAVQTARWTRENSTVSGQALEDAMQKQPWDPLQKSVRGCHQICCTLQASAKWRSPKLSRRFVPSGTKRPLRLAARGFYNALCPIRNANECTALLVLSGTWVSRSCYLHMSNEHAFNEHMRFLKSLATFIRLHEIGIIEEPLPENIKLQLLHMKKAERERNTKIRE